MKKAISPSARQRQVLNMIRKEVKAFAPKIGSRQVVLFGSRATKKHQDVSDFDIGIVGKRPLPTKAFFELETRFEELPTLYKIDLVDFSKTSSAFRQEALKKVKILYP